MGASAPLPHHHFTSIAFTNLRFGWLAHSAFLFKEDEQTPLIHFIQLKWK